MTRGEIHRELLQLTQDLAVARDRIKGAQMRTRVTGLKLPPQDYAAMWEQVYRLERAIEHARLQLATAEETAAERFVTIVRAEHPNVFAMVASRAGVEV